MNTGRDADSPLALLPQEVSENLRRNNPWWDDKPGPPVPGFRRWAFGRLVYLIKEGLTPAVVLRGARRVGKTVLLRQIIESFLAEGVPPTHLLYLPFDELEAMRRVREPILTVAHWFEENVLKKTFNECAREGALACLFFDEVQNLGNWAPQIKHLVDNHAVRVLITGSSSLRIEAGHDSLAGRVTTIEMGPLVLREIAGLRFGFSGPPAWEDNGSDGLLNRQFWSSAKQSAMADSEVRWRAFRAFSQRGGYPMAHERAGVPWREVAHYLNETVIRRAIRHDLRLGARGQKRDETLLEEVFRLACRYTGQAAGQNVFVPEIQQALAANVGWTRILSYLRFLDGSLLIRLVDPLEIRLKRKKDPSKICICDHGLRASWLQEIIPIDPDGLVANPHLTDLAGHIAESVVGYFLGSVPNLDVTYFPARGAEPEVDFVLTVGTRRIPIEVKYRRRIDPHEDTRGLRAFMEKTVYNAPFGLLIVLDDDVKIPDPRIIPISLSTLLWMR